MDGAMLAVGALSDILKQRVGPPSSLLPPLLIMPPLQQAHESSATPACSTRLVVLGGSTASFHSLHVLDHAGQLQEVAGGDAHDACAAAVPVVPRAPARQGRLGEPLLALFQ
jgi:hypothetical protein